MRSARNQRLAAASDRVRARRGVTLLEVLIAIYIMGIGLLALLALFPLGMLSMAQAVQDDRVDVLAAESVALSEAGADLVSRTTQYVIISAEAGAADPQTAAGLAAEFGDLETWAADLERRLIDLKPLLHTRKLRKQYLAALAHIRGIQVVAREMVGLLQPLADPNSPF